MFPALDSSERHASEHRRSAILSAVIFNALIIVALIPVALRGVAYQPVGAALLRRNLLIYGVGGIIVPFVWNQTHRFLFNRPGLVLSGVFYATQ